MHQVLSFDWRSLAMAVGYWDEMTYLSCDSLSRLILWNMIQYSGNSLRLGYVVVWLWQSAVRDYEPLHLHSISRLF